MGRRLSFRKALCLGLSFLLVGELWAMPYAQANLWEQRRAIQHYQNIDPAAAENNAFSQIEKIIGAIKVQQERVGILGNLNLSRYGTTMAEYKPEGWRMSRGLFFLVQDAHGYVSAQKNIAALILEMEKEYKTQIYAEGVEHDYNLESYRSLMGDYKKEITAALTRQGLLSGPEIAALSSEKNQNIFGVEKEKEYLEHVESYKKSAQKQARADELLKIWTKEEKEKLEKFGNKNLSRLLQKQHEYESNRLSLGQYAEILCGASFKREAKMETLARLERMERQINFKEAEKQRAGCAKTMPAKVKVRTSVASMTRLI